MRETILCMVAFCVFAGTAYSQDVDPQGVLNYLIARELQQMEQPDADEARLRQDAARYAVATDAEIRGELDRYCPRSETTCLARPPESLAQEGIRRGMLTLAAPQNRGIDCVKIGIIVDCQ
jgi:hypothetical protein